jgi:hypothetical protein
MTSKMPGMCAKVIRDIVVITWNDAVLWFSQKTQVSEIIPSKVGHPENLAPGPRN